MKSFAQLRKYGVEKLGVKLTNPDLPGKLLSKRATENTELDITRPSKLLGLTSRDWTMRHHVARVDIARPDNPAPWVMWLIGSKWSLAWAMHGHIMHCGII